MAVDASRVVRVRESIAPVVGAVRDFSKVLYVHTAPTTTNATELSERQRNLGVRSYTSYGEVADDWDEADVRDAARVYFAQSPYPGPLAIGSRFSSGQSGEVAGTFTGTRAELQAVSGFSIFGVSVSVTLTSVTSNTALQTALATGINAGSGISGVSVTCSGSFPGGTGTGAIAIRIVLPTALASAAGLNVDAPLSGAGAETLGIAGASAYARPILAETDIEDSMVRFQESDSSWYWCVAGSDISASDARDISAWVETARPRHMLGLSSNEAGTLTAGETTSSFALLFAAGRERTFGVWSGSDDEKALSVAARLSSVDYNASQSVVTVVHKSLPETSPDDTLTSSQQTELERKQSSYYATVRGVPMVLGGTTFDSGSGGGARFIDARAFADWLGETLQNRVLRYLSNVGRVPLTTRGLTQIEGVVKGVCEQAVVNGGFAPGERLDESVIGTVVAITGARGFDGVLPNGYLTHVGPLTQADTSTRTTPPIYVWGVYSNAIHKVTIDVSI